jgi:hypothetical protein
VDRWPAAFVELGKRGPAMRWLRQSSIWQVGSRRPPSIASWPCFVMLTLVHMKHIADTRGWKHSVTCITMRLLLEWDIVLDCLNLGRSFTQMLHQTTVPESQPRRSTNGKVLYMRFHSHRVFSWCRPVVVTKSSARSKAVLRGRMLSSKTNYLSVTPSNDGSFTEPPASPSPATGRL